jgi:Microtubule-binding stalk of dynein motor/ATP-binding dynein motor region
MQVKVRNETLLQEVALHEANVHKAANERKPLLQLAQNAIDSIDKAAITELKVNSKPHALIENCLMAVQILLHGEKTINLHLNWETSRKMIAKVEIFIEQLTQFKPEFVQDTTLTRLEPILSDISISYDKILAKSEVTAKLYTWVTNMTACATAYKHAKPLLDVLSKARISKDLIDKELITIEAKVAQAVHALANTQTAFLSATESKGRAEALCNHANTRLALCERLTRGFVIEKQIWSKQLDTLLSHEQNIDGDVLVLSSYITYTGSYSYATRQEILHNDWFPMLKRGGVHVSKNLQLIDKQHKPLYFIDDAACDNANIVCRPSVLALHNEHHTTTATSMQRCTMLVDTHEIALKWLIEHEHSTNSNIAASDANGDTMTHNAAEVVVVHAREQLPTLSKVVAAAIETGSHLIISYCNFSTPDSTTMALYNLIKPLLQRESIEKGSAKGIKDNFVQMNGCEVSYNHNFRLRLHTQYNLIATPVFTDLLTLCSVIDCSMTSNGLQAHINTAASKVVTSDIETVWQDVITLQAQSEQQARQLEDALLVKLADAQSTILSDSNSSNDDNNSDDSTHLINRIEELESVRDELHDINDEASRSILPLIASTKKERDKYIDVASEAADLYINLLHNNAEPVSVARYSIKAFTDLYTTSLIKAAAAKAQQATVAVTSNDESMSTVKLSQEHDGMSADDSTTPNDNESCPLKHELHHFRLSLYRMMIRCVHPDKRIHTLSQIVFRSMYIGRLVIPGYTMQQTHQGLHYLYDVGTENNDNSNADMTASTAAATSQDTVICPDSFPTSVWSRIIQLQQLQCSPHFNRLAIDVQDEVLRFNEYLLHEALENESLPSIYKDLSNNSPFSELLLIAALRPDRITAAIAVFISKALPRGSDYLNIYSTSSSQERLYECIIQDCSPRTQISLVINSNLELQVLEQAAALDSITVIQVNAISGSAETDTVTMQAMINDAAGSGHWLVIDSNDDESKLQDIWIRCHKQLISEHDQHLCTDDPESSLQPTSTIHSKFRFIVCRTECKLTNNSDAVKVDRSSTHIAYHLRASSIKQALRDNMHIGRSRYNKSDARTRVVIFSVIYLHTVLYERFRLLLDGAACYILDTHTLQHAIAVSCTFMDGNSLKVYTYIYIQYTV